MMYSSAFLMMSVEMDVVVSSESHPKKSEEARPKAMKQVLGDMELLFMGSY